MIKYIKTFIILIFLIQGGFKTLAQNTSPLHSREITDTLISGVILEQFISKENISGTEADAIRKFYVDRDFRFAWFTEDGLAEHVQSLWNRYEQYMNYSKDSSFYSAKLYDTINFLLSEDKYNRTKANTATELFLTHQFYTFIQHVYTDKIDPLNFQWHIPRRKVVPLSLLGELLSNQQDDFDWLPVSKQFLKMRDKLIDLQNRLLIDDHEPIFLENNKLIRPGDSTISIVDVKKRLYISGDLVVPDTSRTYSTEAVTAVMSFQRRHGLAEDGIIGPNVINALNISVEERIKQLMINMERMRWMPERTSGKSVWINIPEFKLHVYENKVEVLTMGIIVGQAANRTVVFSDEIQNVVFSPYWNIPESIVSNEIVPAMNLDPEYLAKKQMEITSTRNGLPVVRQKPGKLNSLGSVKFIFPNRYHIYLHDTPAKQLFEQSSRAFSHGCIRLSKPFELAKYLLKSNAFWTDREINKAMHSGKEQWVKLEEKVPVYIGYFTAWVDASGHLNFREDIYGHDKRMAKQLFKE